MFDVSWEDPASETVAQRRQRKKRDGRSSPHSRGSFNSAESVEPTPAQQPQTPNSSASKKKSLVARGSSSMLKSSNAKPTPKRLSIVTSNTDPNSPRTIIDGDARSPDYLQHMRDSIADTIPSTQLSHGMF
jgi:hypothetical protein